MITHVISAWAVMWSVHDIDVISAWSVSWSVHDSHVTTTSNLVAKHFSSVQFSSVQSLSRVQLFATPWIAAFQASLSITNSRSSLRLKSPQKETPSPSAVHSPLRPPLAITNLFVCSGHFIQTESNAATFYIFCSFLHSARFQSSLPCNMYRWFISCTASNSSL